MTHLTDESVKERLRQKVIAGDTSLPEDLFIAVAEKFGIDVEAEGGPWSSGIADTSGSQPDEMGGTSPVGNSDPAPDSDSDEVKSAEDQDTEVGPIYPDDPSPNGGEVQAGTEVTAGTTETTTEEEGGYETWSNDELSAECESRGLAKSGTKAELVARLEEDDANNA